MNAIDLWEPDLDQSYSRETAAEDRRADYLEAIPDQVQPESHRAPQSASCRSEISQIIIRKEKNEPQ